MAEMWGLMAQKQPKQYSPQGRRDTEENKVKTGGHRGGRGDGGAILRGVSVSAASFRENRPGLRKFGYHSIMRDSINPEAHG
jgi:hypothetical protein